MKKKVLLSIVTVWVLLLCVLALSLPVSAADLSNSSASIAGHNISLEDSIHIIYYADFKNVPSGAEKGILIWTAAQGSYVYGTQKYKLNESTGTYRTYLKYDFTEVAAKMMAQDIYAVAYIRSGSDVVYGPLDKYSVLQYAYNKKTSTTTASSHSTATLGELVSEMLNYGAIAQKYFNYQSTRLANDEFYQLTVENGHISDGTVKGLYPAGTRVSLVADAPMIGQRFAYWVNSAGENVGTSSVVTTASDETYSPVYVYDRDYADVTLVSNGDGTCSVAALDPSASGDLILPPSSLEGDIVTSIGDGVFEDRKNVTSVTIPDSVREIGNNAFRGCSALTEVSIPSALISVGDGAFAGCSSVSSILLPDGVSSVGDGAFEGCSSLCEVAVGKKVERIGAHTFDGCVSLVSADIGTLVREIGESAFADCDSLTSLNVGDCVETIGDYAFAGCSSLASVSIPGTVVYIGDDAFEGCGDLVSTTYDNARYLGNGSNPYTVLLRATSNHITSCQIHPDTKIIYQNAFQSCPLTAVSFPSGVTCIGAWAFSSTNLKTLHVGTGVTNIGYGAFYDCARLTSVFVPDSVTRISGEAFCSCSNLTSVILSSGITEIMSGTFSDCESLGSMVIPAGVTVLHESAFSGCVSLTEITIPVTVTEIGEYAFADCELLDDIWYPGKRSQWYAIHFAKWWQINGGYCNVHCIDGDA